MPEPTHTEIEDEARAMHQSWHAFRLELDPKAEEHPHPRWEVIARDYPYIAHAWRCLARQVIQNRQSA